MMSARTADRHQLRYACIAALTVALLIGLLGSPGFAQSPTYTFRNVVDTTTANPSFSSFGEAVITSDETVVFYAKRPNGSHGIYRVRGEELTTLFETAERTPEGDLRVFRFDISSEGIVAVEVGGRIFVHDGLTLSEAPRPPAWIMGIAVNNAGQVAVNVWAILPPPSVCTSFERDAG